MKTSLHSVALVAVVCLGLVMATAPSTKGSMIAMDLFDTSSGYTSGTNLGGQTSTNYTFGFTEAWPSGSNFFTVQTVPAVSVSGIYNTGGVVRLRPSSANSRALGRTFASSSNNSSMWSSSLFYVQDSAVLVSSNGIESMYGFTSGGLTSTTALWSNSNSATLSGFQIGVSSSSTLVIKYQNDASGVGTIATADTGFALATASPYFIVTQLLVNNSGVGDTLNLWILNTVPSDESAILSITPTYSLSADILTNSGSLNTVLLTSGATGTTYGTVYMDALHLGTEYSDVISVIPEVSTSALVLFGSVAAIGFCLLRRRDFVAS